MPAYIKYILLALFFALGAVNFTRTTLDVIESSKRLESLKGEVSSLEGEKVFLEDDLAFKESDDYVEKEARISLGMVYPGEEIFIADNILGIESYREAVKKVDLEKSNILLWKSLFL